MASSSRLPKSGNASSDWSSDTSIDGSGSDDAPDKFFSIHRSADYKAFLVGLGTQFRSFYPLPEDFCRRHGRKIEGNVILRFTNNDSWMVKVDRARQCCYDLLYLTRGWWAVGDTYQLFHNPVVIEFQFDGCDTFFAVIKRLDISQPVHRRLPFKFPIKKTEFSFIMVSGGQGDVAVPGDGFNYFAKSLTAPYMSRLYVPVGFFNDYVLKRKEVDLKFEGISRVHKGTVFVRGTERGCDLGGDWVNFVKHHGMQIGVTYCFKIWGSVRRGVPLVEIAEH